MPTSAVVGRTPSGGEIDLAEKTFQLPAHHLGPADVRVQGLFAEDHVVPMLTVVQNLLALHALGHARRHVVGDAEEVDDLAEDHGRVRLGLEGAPDHGGDVRLAVPRLLVQVDDFILDVFRAGGQALLPWHQTRHCVPFWAPGCAAVRFWSSVF